MIEELNLNKSYNLIDAIKIIKEKSFAKFEETLDVAIRLNIDANKTEQNIRGVINLP